MTATTTTTFAPTFRFIKNTDLSNQRIYDEWCHPVPSWCDRVLYKTLGHPVDRARCLEYNADHSVRSSHHSPVYAIYEVKIRRQYVCRAVKSDVCAFLEISELFCRGLINADVMSLSDPWIQFLNPFFAQPMHTTRTRTLENTLDPEWDEKLDLRLYPVSVGMLSSEYLKMVIYDEDVNSNDTLGQVVISLHRLAVAPNEPILVSCPIVANGVPSGQVHARILLHRKEVS